MDRLSQTAVLCHLNIDKPETKPISKQFHLGGIPTVVILDPKGQEVDRIIGYEGNRSDWLKVLLASLYGIDTISDLQVRYAGKPDLKLAHQLAQKYLDRGDGTSSLVWVEKTRSLKPDSDTSSKLTLIEGEATLFTDPPKGVDMLLKLATTPGSPLALDAFQNLSAFYKRQARNATNAEEKQKAKAARLEVFHKVVAAQPSDPEVLAEYAWYCAGEGIELDKAIAAAQKAAEIKPNDGDTLSTLAEVQFKLGRKDEAVKTIDKAIAAEPDEQSFKDQKEKFLKGESQK